MFKDAGFTQVLCWHVDCVWPVQEPRAIKEQLILSHPLTLQMLEGLTSEQREEVLEEVMVLTRDLLDASSPIKYDVAVINATK